MYKINKQGKIFSTIIVIIYISISMISYKNIDLNGISLQICIIFFLSLLWNIINFKRKDKISSFFERKSFHSMDTVALLLTIYEMVLIIVSIFDNSQIGAIDFKLNIIIVITIFFYYPCSNGMRFKESYFNLIIFTGIIGYGIILYGYLCENSICNILDNLFCNSGTTASYILLVCIICIYFYCTCNNRLKCVFYFIASAAGFFTLIINNNTISLWIMTFSFFLIPVLLYPTAALIKRDMKTFFLFIFMLSSIGIIEHYFPLFLVNQEYTLERSIFLDVILVMGGAFFLLFWERIPKNIDLHKVILTKMFKRYCVILMVIGIIFFSILAGGTEWNILELGENKVISDSILMPLISEVQQNQNVLEILLSKQGIVGTILVLTFFSQLLLKIIRNYSMDKPITAILLLISIIFVFQILFWIPSISILPVYILLFLFAAFYEEKIYLSGN